MDDANAEAYETKHTSIVSESPRSPQHPMKSTKVFPSSITQSSSKLSTRQNPRFRHKGGTGDF
ncbi:hypothetical protein [Corynebacterium deserti]|uniref:hypothetical protein n=1 Tax=Corynebacterium deserti TaxID=1408191 RepID=UPI0038B24AA7